MFGNHRRATSTGLVIGALAAIGLTVIVTDGFVDAVLLMLATGLLVASYAARRYTRDVFLYRARDDRSQATDEPTGASGH
jgi:hypothetical protein